MKACILRAETGPGESSPARSGAQTAKDGNKKAAARKSSMRLAGRERGVAGGCGSPKAASSATVRRETPT